MITRNIGLLMILMTVVSCNSKTPESRRGAGDHVKEYQVMEIKLDSTRLFDDYPAMLKGQQTVEIRPRVAGYIDQILVDEGAYVKKGQLLFKLNDNDLLAMVRSGEAMVKVAEADVNAAQINLDKTIPLAEKNIVSSFDLQTAQSTLQAKRAQLAQAKANLENARANLSYTYITSPTEGTIGIFPYRVGSLVNSAITEPMTMVSNTSRVFAYFSVNEKDFLVMAEKMKGKSFQEKLSHFPEVRLIMADNTIFGLKGKIDAASGIIDPVTGAVTMRATFPNPEGLLLSGGSGMVRIPQSLDSVIIIPQKSTYDLQNKHFVYLVGADNKVHNTEIEILDGNLKNTYVVTSGLKPGDKIVLEGLVTLRNDMTIIPKMTDPGVLSENVTESDQKIN